MNHKELSAEVDAAQAAALAAGEIILHYYNDRSFDIGSKGKNNPVTTADLEADREIRRRLTESFGGYGWLSEESVDEPSRLERRRVWIVDPLDGTKEFIKGVPEFCVAIALAEDHVAVLGVTYNPVRREMFWAAKGLGCWLNGRRVAVSTVDTLDRATVLASRSEFARGEWEVFHGAIKISPTGSVAYKLAMIAGGIGDGSFTRLPKNEWDVAAGTALIVEAGGRVTDLAGNDLRFNRKITRIPDMVASNGLLHDALIELASANQKR